MASKKRKARTKSSRKRAAKAQRIVSKVQLAGELRWSSPKLDRRIATDANFPVLERGGIHQPWKFDLDAVLAYLAAVPVFRKPGRPQQTPAEAAAGAPAESKIEATAKQRRDNAQASMFEDKVRQRRGELCEAEDVRMVIGTMTTKLGATLDSMPELVGQQCNLTEDVVERIRAACDAARLEMIATLKPLLA